MSDRNRWGGFHLGESKRDRAIAAWLDQVAADRSVNVSELVKDYLYRLAISQDTDDPTARAVIDALSVQIGELRVMLARGVTVANSESGEVEDSAEIARRLGSLPD